MDLLRALITVSEKAANIARVCRKDEHLFELLVQKKSSSEANPRFVEDFKTLADVLIQEMVKHDITKQFQELSDKIKGEETNVFKNTLGETICVEVKATEEETSALLETVLNGDRLAADLLAAEVHRDIRIEDMNVKIPKENFDVALEELGIWIDPIDCTAEYINGRVGTTDRNNIQVNGLKCVTILIGVFNKVNGVPVMGVINRPFLAEQDNRSSDNCIWGVSLTNYRINSSLTAAADTNLICISNSENEEVRNKLKEAGFDLILTCGAGYKLLTVILGLTDAYILTKATTFKWDTCGPHSILRSLGGDILEFEESFINEKKSIKYSITGASCNLNGIIAYRKEETLSKLCDIFKSE